MKKRFYALFCTFLLLIIFPLNVFAKQTAEIYSETVSTKENSIFFVPVKIKNNPGIMGFKVTVKYDPKILSYPTVSRGTVTENGTINDGIGVGEDGSFDVVWSNTENVIDNGVLFVVGFNSSETVESEKTDIIITYSQPDTFNEKYEDVAFDCKTITVKFGSEASAENKTEAVPSREVTDSDIVLAVKTALKTMRIDSVANVSPDNMAEFIDEVNANIKKITGNDEDYFKDADKIIPQFKESVSKIFISESTSAVNSSVISEIIEDALDNANAESISALADDKKADFVSEVESELKKRASDISGISDKLNTDESVEVISQLQQENEKNAVSGTKIEDRTAEAVKKRVIIIVCIVFIASAAVATTAIILRKKYKKTEEEKNNEENS